MTHESKAYKTPRRKSDRRSGRDRRTGEDRRTGKDTKDGLAQTRDPRFEGVLRTTETVSHLFSQPLTVVMGYVDLLSFSTGEENTREKLKTIKEQLKVMRRHLENLRDLREYKTIYFSGATLLDIEKPKQKDDN